MDIVTKISTFEIEAIIEASYIKCVFDPYTGRDRWFTIRISFPNIFPSISVTSSKIEEALVPLAVPELTVPGVPTVSVSAFVV